MGLRLVFALLFALATAGATQAQSSIQNGIDLVQQGRAADARTLFLEMAEDGNAEAMYHLGALHHSGLGGPEDLKQAIGWYRKASMAGVPEAKLALGSLLFNGKGTAKNFSEALTLFSEAAESGLIAAQYNLALMHAAGLAHSKEYGADEDRPRAYKWFTIVLAQLDEGAERAMVEEGFAVLKGEMTYEEIAQGKALATAWLDSHPIKESAQ